MVSKYSTGLSAPLATGVILAPSTDETVVLLTGSTGSLGAQILETLLKATRVRKVYALNRPSSGTIPVEERQKERFADRGLDASVLETDRLVFLDGDAAQEKLGLEDRTYDEVRFAAHVQCYTVVADHILCFYEIGAPHSDDRHPQRLARRLQSCAGVLRRERPGDAQPDRPRASSGSRTRAQVPIRVIHLVCVLLG